MTGRRVGLLVAALVGIVVVAVGVVAFVLPASHDDPGTAPPSSTATVRAGTAKPPVTPTLTGVDPRRFACPSPKVLSRPTSGVRLPTGAVSVAECASDARPDFSFPQDHLTRHVDRWVRLVNAATPGLPADCSGTGDAPPTLAFGYPDGAVRAVTPDSCGQIQVGTTLRATPRGLYDRFTSDLVAQRRRSGPPGGRPSVPACVGNRPRGLSSQLGLETLRIPKVPVAARACIRSPVGHPVLTQTVLSHDELVRLVRFSAPARHRWPCTSPMIVVVQGVTVWRDDVAFTRSACVRRAHGGLDLKGGNEHLLHQIIERAVPVRHRS